MGILYPILAAILQAGSFTLDKIILSIKRVSYKTYTGVSFPLLFGITLVIFLIFRPPLSLSLFENNLWLLILLSIAITIATNLIFYRALHDDRLGEIQTFDLLHNIPIIILTSLIFSDERNFSIIIPAIVASLAILWSHREKHHFRVARHTLPFLIWSVTGVPIGAAILKVVLETWNPISLELVRSFFTAIILGFLFYKEAARVPPKAFRILVFTNILTSIAWILFYFSYQKLGVVYTLLIFSIQPLLVYLSSIFFLKEPHEKKKTIAFFVVMASIAIAQVFS